MFILGLTNFLTNCNTIYQRLGCLSKWQSHFVYQRIILNAANNSVTLIHFSCKISSLRTVMTGVFPHTYYCGIHKKISSPEKVFPIHFQVRGRPGRTPDVSEDIDSGTIVDSKTLWERCKKDTQNIREKSLLSLIGFRMWKGNKKSKTARGWSFQFRNSFKHLSLDILMRNWSTNEIVHCSLWNTLTWWNGREIRFWWNRFARGLNCNKTGERNGIVLQFCTFSVGED